MRMENIFYIFVVEDLFGPIFFGTPVNLEICRKSDLLFQPPAKFSVIRVRPAAAFVGFHIQYRKK